MIDVEQRALGALEKDSLTLAPLAIEQRPHRVHVGQDARRDVGRNFALWRQAARLYLTIGDAVVLAACFDGTRWADVERVDGAVVPDAGEPG